MPATSLTRSPLRDLASRINSGVEVTLFWNEHTGALIISVWNSESDKHMQFVSEPDKALHAFYHPYTYAESIGVSPMTYSWLPTALPDTSSGSRTVSAPLTTVSRRA